MEADFFLKMDDGKVVIEGFSAQEKESLSDWQAVSLGEDRLLIAKNGKDSSFAEGFHCFSSARSLFHMFYGLCVDQWSGVVRVVSPGYAVRKVYFNKGDIVFAVTDLVEERLGEILYREGHLSLDTFSKAAVSVTGHLKFGQVLIKEGVVTYYNLWCFLHQQMRYIIESLFVSNLSYVALSAEVKSPTQLVCVQGTKEFLDSRYAEGLAFQRFVQSLTNETKVLLIQGNESSLGFELSQSDYFREFSKIVGSEILLGKLLKAIKSHEMTLLRYLWRLVQQGVCICTHTKSLEDKRSWDREVGALIDSYHQSIEKISDQSVLGKSFDLADLEEMISSLNSDTPCLFIDGRGRLTKNSISCILVQSQLQERADRIKSKIRVLCSFLELMVSQV